MAEEIPQDSKTARYWRESEGGGVVCELCPHHCRLKDGQRGLCYARACRGDELVLTAYGRSSGFCVDPIEKKPLNHFLPGSAILSFGTAGCNLRCRFCQNWSISRSRQAETLADAASPEQIAQSALRLECPSVAFTYNEPVIFLEYAVDIAQACHRAGVRTVAVTAGYICEEPRKEFFAHMDAANVDLKAFSDRFYRELCGGDLQTVLDTLVYIRRHTAVWLELTTLLIPGENDSEQEVDAMTKWVAGELGPDVPLHFTAFHPDYKMTDSPPTPGRTLTRAREIGLRNGLRYVFTGNVHDPQGASTYCHQCGRLLIRRDGYALGEWNLTDAGACRFCGTACAGVFGGGPGSWAGGRRPVRMN